MHGSGHKVPKVVGYAAHTWFDSSTHQHLQSARSLMTRAYVASRWNNFWGITHTVPAVYCWCSRCVMCQPRHMLDQRAIVPTLLGTAG